jgi:F0F1-type ATP synthase epsilon subunit
VTRTLRFVIRTPHEIVLDRTVGSARIPTEGGQVGLRPRQEGVVFPVSPGLVVLRAEGGVAFAATAGGLLEADRESALLYTPFGVTGTDRASVLDALERILTTPDSEIAVRRRLLELERRIVREVHPKATVLRPEVP